MFYIKLRKGRRTGSLGFLKDSLEQRLRRRKEVRGDAALVSLTFIVRSYLYIEHESWICVSGLIHRTHILNTEIDFSQILW